MKSKIIIIGGTGRNTGKTTLACLIINKFTSNLIKTTAIKISTHFHEQSNDSNLIKKTDNYEIYEEKHKDESKDSTRMLKAGAEKVFYIQSKEEFVKSAFDETFKLISDDSFIVVESFTLGKENIKSIKILLTGGDKIIKPELKNSMDYVLNFDQINNFTEKIKIIDKQVYF